MDVCDSGRRPCRSNAVLMPPTPRPSPRPLSGAVVPPELLLPSSVADDSVSMGPVVSSPTWRIRSSPYSPRCLQPDYFPLQTDANGNLMCVPAPPLLSPCSTPSASACPKASGPPRVPSFLQQACLEDSPRQKAMTRVKKTSPPILPEDPPSSLLPTMLLSPMSPLAASAPAEVPAPSSSLSTPAPKPLRKPRAPRKRKAVLLPPEPSQESLDHKAKNHNWFKQEMMRLRALEVSLLIPFRVPFVSLVEIVLLVIVQYGF